MTIPFNKSVICPVLIGRAAHLAKVDHLLNEVRHNRGQTLLIAGEAGLGKSRLVAEVKRMAAHYGFTLLQGACFEPDRVLPYAPLLDMLRSYYDAQAPTTAVEALAPFAAELTYLLPELGSLVPTMSTEPRLDPLQEKRRLFQALSQFLLQRPTPLLVVIEDLHWSDDISLEFLLSFARRIAAQPIMLLLTYRHDELYTHPALPHFLAELDRSRMADELTLDRLSRAEVEQMMREIFEQARPIQAEFVESVYALTDGNPFFVEEILKALIAIGEVYYTGQAWQRKPLHTLHIPRSVQDAVQRRAQHLSQAARRLVTLAAVAGRRFDFALLPPLTQQTEGELLPLIKELITAQLVVEESAEQFAFRHALTRQAISAGLLGRERQAMHQAIGETMEQIYAAPARRDAHLADLAYHFYEAGNWAKALAYAYRAGEQAQNLYAPRAAVEHFSRAVEAAHHLDEAYPEGSPRLLSLYRGRGQAYETLGEWDQAHADYTRVMNRARDTGDRHAEWQSLIDLGALWASRNYQTTGDYFRQALELAQTMQEPVTLGQSLNRLGNWLANVGQPRAGRQHHQEALIIFESLDEPQGLAQTLDLLGTANYLAGDLVRGTDYYQRAVEMFRALGDRAGLASSLANLAMRASIDTLSATGTLPEAVDDGELAVQLSREIGWRANEAVALCHVAMCRRDQGDFARALEAGQAALAIADEIEHRLWMSYARFTVGTVYAALLDDAAAQSLLETAHQMVQALDSPNWRALAAAALATVYLQQHKLAQAGVVLAGALPPGQPIETPGQQWAEAVRGELALARGDAKLALQIVDGLIASSPYLAEGRIAPQLIRQRGEALAALGRQVEAEAALRAVEAENRARGARRVLWQIHRALGQLYKQQGRHSEAEREFAAARDLVDALAANLPDPAMRAAFLQRIHALIPAAPVLTPRQAAKQAWGGLTGREREVAVQIAQGKSNREIAAALTVSAKTVEAHISRILSKLGYTSRAQIAAWSVDKGLTQAPPDLFADSNAE